jgi:hypothetical protein
VTLDAAARRIVDRYAGVSVANVARLEHLAPYEIRGIRARAGRRVDDGLPLGERTWKEQLSYDDLDRMMRTNRAPA